MVVAAGGEAWRALRLGATRLSDRGLKQLGPWLILAPHPDDETLGAAGLIAALAARGHPAWVAFLTDGSASHPGAPDWPPRRIARRRADEARLALRALGAPAGHTLHLGWRDAAPHGPEAPEFARTCRALLGFCRRRGIRSVAATWRGEAHCDHAAAYGLAAALTRSARGRIALFEYLVWGWADPDLLIGSRGFRRFAIGPSGPFIRGRNAIRRHRSQMSDVIRGAEAAFRLPHHIAALAERAPAIILKGNDRHAP